MDRCLAVHTLARRYCLDQHALWVQKYSALEDAGRRVGEDYSPEAYDTFPRYLVLDAILEAIEAITPDRAGSVEELVDRLLVAAGATSTSTTVDPPNEIAESAINEERARFIRHIGNLSEEEIRTAKPLPFRQPLGANVLRLLWEALDSKWKTDGGYWYPLRSETMPKGMLAFHTDYFDEEKASGLAGVLADYGVERLFELREGKQEGLELDLEFFYPLYTGLEGYWTSEKADWLVYASHESSITLAGDWLVEAFRARFVDCDEYQYRGAFSTSDLRGTWTPAERG